MKNELIIKKCKNCGAVIMPLKDCNCENCGIKCCETEMERLVPNSFEASIEKHIPNYEKVEDEIYVTLAHPMEKEHYIEWIALVHDNTKDIINLYPEQKAECRFKYIPGSTIYAYCNKHELWKKDVE